MRLLSTSLALFLAPSAFAAEGMWTLDNLPLTELDKRYGFKPDRDWFDHAMRSAVRLAGGCSGSFVSKSGLVLTNGHCVLGCVQDLSSEENDYVNGGFIAAANRDEKQCPGAEINVLTETSDVTERVQKATRRLEGKAFQDAKRAEQSKIESECAGGDAALRCDIVELYQGGIQHLYKYQRFQDVRLVFSPDYAAAFFGGDPDNFNFPRYNLDMGLLRVYVDGKPYVPQAHFRIDAAGPKENELVMTLGHPGSTKRLLTMTQLETQRDAVLPFRLMFAHELRGLLLRFSAESGENARIAQSDLTSVENGLKVRHGMFDGLRAADVMSAKRAAEDALREWVAADKGRRERYGDPWSQIAKAQPLARDIYVEYVLTEGGLGKLSQHLNWARTLVRGAAERSKPDGERLREFAEAGLPAITAELLAKTPLYPHYEEMRLAWSLAKLREYLGVDSAYVAGLLGTDSPEAVAKRIVTTSALADSNLRKTLWEGGAKALDASTDPAISLIRRIDAADRAVRARYENEVEAIEKRAAEQLAQARFAKEGTSVYPDATFSLRLSHGVVAGWIDRGKSVAAFTDFAGLYDRARDHDPFKLAPRWLAAKGALDANTRFNYVTTNDIIGGNSGSPLINAKGEVVGLAFDGNTPSIGGAFFFDAAVNRCIAVHPAAIGAALDKVYGAQHLAAELGLK